MLIGAGGMGYGLAWWVRHLVLRGANEAVAVDRVRQRFGAYVPAQFATLDAHNELGGERYEIAVLFSDLRGFTNYSEKLAPDALITELNSYFDAMVATIHDHGGVVDKFGQWFVDQVVASESFGGFGPSICELRLAERLDDAGVVGAALLAADRIG